MEKGIYVWPSLSKKAKDIQVSPSEKVELNQKNFVDTDFQRVKLRNDLVY